VAATGGGDAAIPPAAAVTAAALEADLGQALHPAPAAVVAVALEVLAAQALDPLKGVHLQTEESQQAKVTQSHPTREGNLGHVLGLLLEEKEARLPSRLKFMSENSLEMSIKTTSQKYSPRMVP